MVDKSHGFTDATGWALQGESSGGRIAFVYGNGSSFPEVFSTTNVLDNSWHFIVGTLDGITLKIYIDGSLEGSLPYTGTPAGNTRDVNIGASWGGGLFTRFFDGLIDEVTLYDRALSDAEILAIYNAGNAGKCKEVTCNNFPCGNNKVVVCHVPPGNPSNAHEICISVNAVKAHLNNHDDYCGPCDTSSKRYYEQVEYGEQVEYQLDDQSHLIQIYPNPFDGLIVLKIGSQNLTEKENLTFTMYDLLSKKVIQINNPKANRITLETSQLGSGLYFYQVTRAEKIIKIGKIIKQ
ncbi:MAG: T9SS type A sorting domain-containing protein [Bacteroidetes bacterium]|nr:T9SS type A sorting domain-containing protein [Bacteroidota bacterium]